MSKTPRPTKIAGTLVAIVVIGLAVLATAYHKRPCIEVDGSCLSLETVTTPEAIRQGLSGRESLDQGSGMLFVFENESEYCFWMKDMKFPLDMIWLNNQKEVVKVKENVSPDTYPDSFCPDQPVKYVLEVNAGVASQARISQGSRLQF